MKIATLEVGGFHPAMIAMRLPMKSGDKSDSGWTADTRGEEWFGVPYCAYWNYWTAESYFIGEKDHELATMLCKAGRDHRNSIRQIDAWAVVEAPLFWWKQMDRYRIGVERSSESTMHTLMKQPLSLSDFELPERSDPNADMYWNHEIYDHLQELEALRQAGDFEGLNALLPQSYLQTRIMKFSYEALRNIYHARKNHKLKQWHVFCDWVETLPYSEFITEPAS